MKREVKSNFVLVFGFILLLGIGFVAAQGTGGGSPLSDLGSIVEGAFDFVAPLLTIIFGAPTGSDLSISSDYLSRIMFFTIIFALVYLTFLKMPFLDQNTPIRWILTIAVTVLATRWLSSEAGGTLVQTLLLPYDALGLSLAAFLPLAIYFVFLEFGFKGREHKTIRKSGWIFFLVVFVFLWVARAPELAISAANYAGWVYPISAVLCLIFFWFDKTIQTFFSKASVDYSVAKGKAHSANYYNEKLAKLTTMDHTERTGYTSVFSHGSGEKAVESDIKEYQKRIVDLKS